jgi:hypothetical protein
MNYLKIHNALIERSRSRIRDASIKYESHHVVPICEGGSKSGTKVLLTQKEHRVVHLLRYKLSNVIGNKLAYNMMKYGRSYLNQNHKLISSLGGSAHHSNWKRRDESSYKERQSMSGKIGGESSKNNKRGFFSLSDEDISNARAKGRTITVKNKLGMFNDEFRKKKAEDQQKQVMTPNGVFRSMVEAALFYNVVPSTITYRVNSKSKNWKDWSYL